ncbi:phospholipase [Bacillus tuaregi]|uniref:phospholipase n=1 Tax=Bacillus tuaregi TaxID=1816695 RepID=UPI000A0448AF|nr:phospholipase [Bacillus tuaregi]
MSENRRRRPGFCIFPDYNWCGPGCNGPGAPINDLDALCKEHDTCYRQSHNRCACDQLFLRRLRSQVNPHTQKGRQAQLIYNYMKFQTLFTCNFHKR